MLNRVLSGKEKALHKIEMDRIAACEIYLKNIRETDEKKFLAVRGLGFDEIAKLAGV